MSLEGDDMAMNDRGFSLIEVMVALAILAIGLLGLLNLSFYAIRANKQNKEIIWARLLAEQTAQDLQLADYDDALLQDDGDTTDLDDISNPDHSSVLVGNDDDGDGRTDEELADGLDNDGDGLIDEDLRNYSIVWNVADDVPAAQMKTIRVITIWTKNNYRHTSKVNLVRGRYRW